MVLVMMFGAQPFNLKRLRIVVVVRLAGKCSTNLTRLSNQPPAFDGLVDLVVCSDPFWIPLPVGHTMPFPAIPCRLGRILIARPPLDGGLALPARPRALYGVVFTLSGSFALAGCGTRRRLGSPRR